MCAASELACYMYAFVGVLSMVYVLQVALKHGMYHLGARCGGISRYGKIPCITKATGMLGQFLGTSNDGVPEPLP